MSGVHILQQWHEGKRLRTTSPPYVDPTYAPFSLIPSRSDSIVPAARSPDLILVLQSLHKTSYSTVHAFARLTGLENLDGDYTLFKAASVTSGGWWLLRAWELGGWKRNIDASVSSRGVINAWVGY